MPGPDGDEWVARYSQSHQHPVNKACHFIGIPMIVISLLLAVPALLWHALWIPAMVLFLAGWLLQFIGHWVEGKPPEFFSDRRFLLVGLRWWFAKVRGRGQANGR
jgi:uncharacterized membrane protein YGL010W